MADEALREGQFVAGANRDGWHLRGVEAGRDYEPRFADLREPREGDRCPECGGALRFRTAIEVGHIFNFGAFYSGLLENLGATYHQRRWVEDGNLIMSAGVSAGIDMALHLAARLTDEATARRVQRAIDYDPQPPWGGIDYAHIPRFPRVLRGAIGMLAPAVAAKPKRLARAGA